jgi:hypothetical protein
VDKLFVREKETSMKNDSLGKLRGPLRVRAACLLLLMAVVTALLVTSSVSFAKSGAGTQPTAVAAIFVAISQHLKAKPMYPHDTKRKDLKIGDILDLRLNEINGQAAIGKYAGSNQVTVNNKILTLTFINNTRATPILDLQPLSMSFIGNQDCKGQTTFVCTAIVSNRKNAQSNLNWFAYVDFPGRVVFNPLNGSLAPNSSMKITITIPLNACTPGLFYFQGPRNTHTITWACNPKSSSNPS